jgi:hypothetical protein
MTDGGLVRNSRILGVFAEIVRGPLGTLQAVEIAGHGIAAGACCTLAALADKMSPGAGTTTAAVQAALEYADWLMELDVIEDDLSSL